MRLFFFSLSVLFLCLFIVFICAAAVFNLNASLQIKVHYLKNSILFSPKISQSIFILYSREEEAEKKNKENLH